MNVSGITEISWSWVVGDSGWQDTEVSMNFEKIWRPTGGVTETFESLSNHGYEWQSFGYSGYQGKGGTATVGSRKGFMDPAGSECHWMSMITGNQCYLGSRGNIEGQ